MKYIQISEEEGSHVLIKIEEIRKTIEKKTGIKTNAGVVKYAILKILKFKEKYAILKEKYAILKEENAKLKEDD